MICRVVCTAGRNNIMWITVVDTNEKVVQAAGKRGIDACCGSIFDPVLGEYPDAVVSPANSFGFMDGGIDWEYTCHFGIKVADNVKRFIKDTFGGELLVGQACVVETNSSRIQFLVVAPTMRVPTNIYGTANVYLAVRAALHVSRDMGFKHVAFPGMGTGVGMMPPYAFAKQMSQAIKDPFNKDYDTLLDARNAHSTMVL